jgi:hypothetical protein
MMSPLERLQLQRQLSNRTRTSFKPPQFSPDSIFHLHIQTTLLKLLHHVVHAPSVPPALRSPSPRYPRSFHCPPPGALRDTRLRLRRRQPRRREATAAGCQPEREPRAPRTATAQGGPWQVVELTQRRFRVIVNFVFLGQAEPIQRRSIEIW